MSMTRTKLALSLGLLVWPGLAKAAEEPVKTLEIGAAAPDFRLQGVDDRWYTLKDFAKAKILVVVFTCNHCPTAQYYEERLKSLVTEFKSRGVALVAISPNDENSVRLDELGYTDLSDSFAEMKIRAAYKKFNYPYLYEGDRTGVARAYGPTATPHAFVFDAGRKLRYVGRIDDSERIEYVKVHDLRNALEAMVPGKPVPVERTRAFGCSIKWAGKADSVRQFMAKLAAEPVTVEMADAAALAALRKNNSGKLRLVNFWATWCGPCLTEFPEFVTINRMYRRRAFELVSVAANYPDEKKDVLDTLTKFQASSRNLLFADTDKYKLMEAFDKDWNAALPYTVLIAPTGEYLYKVQGPIDPLELKRAIVRALKEDRFK
jgi:thiol-disulfide isomerase/thioredoxin